MLDTAWLPFLIVGIFITVLLAAAVPVRTAPPKPRKETIEGAQRTEPARSALTGLTLFFWLALVLTIAVIILAYAIPS